MCDTFAFFSRAESGRSFFAKNSDRDPGEPQIMEQIDDAEQDFQTGFLVERLKKYTNGPYHTLKKVFPKYDHPYAAIVSRPLWIWGAEMGLNEKGVAMGNEAVFARRKLKEDGLLGMDILRLALHNAATADEAADFIIELIEKYGQGGNGSYSGTLKYHNSFLIKDPHKIVVLETAGNQWAVKETVTAASISNCYTPGDDYKKASEEIAGKNLTRDFENRFFTFFARGHLRQRYTFAQVSNRDKRPEQVFRLLRSHIRSGNNHPKGGMKSVCVHPGLIVKSETTASLVVDYRFGKQIVWHTSAPNPCVALYKPFILRRGRKEPLFADRQKSLLYFFENRKRSAYLLKHFNFFEKEVKPLRDQTEQRFLEIIYNDLENKSMDQTEEDIRQCFRLEKEYQDTVRTMLEMK